jgi:DNA-binding helix-hairpin-helix protein with protein kinase domain
LFAWRASCEQQFRYDPSKPLPPAAVNPVKIKHAQTRQSAMEELREGAVKLETLEIRTREATSLAKVEILQLARDHAQSIADLSVCR